VCFSVCALVVWVWVCVCGVCVWDLGLVCATMCAWKRVVCCCIMVLCG